MKEYVISLTPTSGFEILPHSDTIFGAICWGIRTLYSESKLLEILNDFKSKPPFLLSSAFPWKVVRKKKVYFLPKPEISPIAVTIMGAFINRGVLDLPFEPYHNEDKLKIMRVVTAYKKFRNIKWVPFDSFKKILQNFSEENLFIDYLDQFINDHRFLEEGIIQKNSLDRLAFSTACGGETFYNTDIAYRENNGLYFLIKTENLDDYLRSVLRLLEDSGIGPNSRTGRNWFKLDIAETSLIGGTKGDAFITLSRYIGSDPIDVDASCYKLTSVRSKVESRLEFAGEDVWKDRVTYFAAGSCLKPLEKKVHYGGLMPVKNISGKIIYQYGYAYPAWLSFGG